MCTKKWITKKRREKNENKEPGYLLHPKWAFYPQLCIYWFLVLRGYKVQRCTFLRVRESILKCRLPSGSSDRLKPTTEFFCLGRGVKCGLARPPTQRTVGEACRRSFARPRTVPREKKARREGTVAYEDSQQRTAQSQTAPDMPARGSLPGPPCAVLLE